MRRRLYIPPEVKESISKHFSKAIKNGIDGFLSANEDEDTMTGHLGALLRIRNQRVQVQQQEISGDWVWSVDYYKFRGRGPQATENILGADGLFELKLNLGGRIESKSVLFQSKLNWSSDLSLLSQCIKLSTWREAAFVLNYRSDQFQAFLIDEVIRSRGNYSGNLTFFPLEEFLGKLFLDCEVGDNDLNYNARARKLIWRTLVGEIVSVKFSIPQRLRVNVEAPRSEWGKHKNIDREITLDEIHKYRMEAKEEDILSLKYQYTNKELKSSYKNLALTYHPDKYNELEELERIILQRRMQEINDTYSYVSRKKRSQN